MKNVEEAFRSSKGLSKRNQKRVFNVISNRYWQAHDDRTERENEILRQEIEEKKARVLDYDIIKTRFNDQEKEAAFRQRRSE